MPPEVFGVTEAIVIQHTCMDRKLLDAVSSYIEAYIEGSNSGSAQGPFHVPKKLVRRNIKTPCTLHDSQNAEAWGHANRT